MTFNYLLVLGCCKEQHGIWPKKWRSQNTSFCHSVCNKTIIRFGFRDIQKNQISSLTETVSISSCRMYWHNLTSQINLNKLFFFLKNCSTSFCIYWTYLHFLYRDVLSSALDIYSPKLSLCCWSLHFGRPPYYFLVTWAQEGPCEPLVHSRASLYEVMTQSFRGCWCKHTCRTRLVDF